MCEICFDELEKGDKIIKCIKCGRNICEECGERWLMLESIIYTCPLCKENWDFNFIYNNFTKRFINNKLKNNY